MMLRSFRLLVMATLTLCAISVPLVTSLLGQVTSVEVKSSDVVVYGGTSGGIAAAIQSARLGKTVVLIEPSNHLGGLTTGGLGATDIGNKAAIGGLSREFYQRVGKWYADPKNWVHESASKYNERRKSSGENEMWTFEPHVAMKVYKDWLAEYPTIQVVMNERLDLKNGVKKNPTTRAIESISMESGKVYTGKVFIDATYEGDLMAKAGVPYHVGREGESVYGETLNGIRVEKSTHHQFTHKVDPYVIPGKPESGLIPLIQAGGPGEEGAGDHRVQAYNYRMCTTDVAENRRAWPKPEGYDEKRTSWCSGTARRVIIVSRGTRSGCPIVRPTRITISRFRRIILGQTTSILMPTMPNDRPSSMTTSDTSRV